MSVRAKQPGMSAPMIPRRPGGLFAPFGRRLDRLDERKYSLLLFVPAALMFMIFVGPPIVAVFVMSTFRIELLKDLPTGYVGLHNIARMLADPQFTDSIPRTAAFTIGSTAITLPLAVVAALLMNLRGRLSAVIGISVLLPWTIAPIVTGFYWRFMFQPSFGLATQLATIAGFHHGAIPWLQDTKTAMAIAVVASSWRTIPLLALIILASLRSIPDSLYRAARMDGASAWQSFRHITFPAIRSTLLIATVLNVIISLQVFDIIFQLTKGGPGFETTTMAYYVYDAAFNYLSLGYSAMLALVLLLVIVVFSSAALVFRSRASKVIETEDTQQLMPRALSQRKLVVERSALAVAYSTPTPRPWSRTVRRLERPFAIAVGALFLFWSLGPTLWIFVASLEPEGSITSVPFQLTTGVTLSHYVLLLTNPDWLGSISVSVQVALATTAIALVIGSLAAYPLARLRLPGRRAILGLLILSQMVPAIVLVIPVLIIFNTLKLTDTVTALILANVAFVLPLVIWILKGVFEKVPRALDAAARMDGCGRLGALFRVTIPAASAGIAATAVLLLISTWNEFLFAVVLGNHDAVTVTRRIGFIDSPFQGMAGEPPYDVQAAAGMVAVLPCLILVALFHRRIGSALTEGYMKG
jgi:multiple sugar transport system permease protein